MSGMMASAVSARVATGSPGATDALDPSSAEAAHSRRRLAGDTLLSLEGADEVELIEAAQQGSEEGFRVLVGRYRKRAYWLAYQLVHDEQDAHDIAQQAFVRVFRSIHRFDRRYKFYTWLYKIVTNLSVDLLRKRGDRKRVSIDKIGDVRSKEMPIGRGLEHAELSERVHEVLDRLPPKYRAVMVLRELKGIDAKEIAKMVDSTHATVRWRLHRARALFREEWEKLYGDDLERGVV